MSGEDTVKGFEYLASWICELLTLQLWCLEISLCEGNLFWEMMLLLLWLLALSLLWIVGDVVSYSPLCGSEWACIPMKRDVTAAQNWGEMTEEVLNGLWDEYILKNSAVYNRRWVGGLIACSLHWFMFCPGVLRLTRQNTPCSCSTSHSKSCLKGYAHSVIIVQGLDWFWNLIVKYWALTVMPFSEDIMIHWTGKGNW